MKLRGERSEEATECCNEATQHCGTRLSRLDGEERKSSKEWNSNLHDHRCCWLFANPVTCNYRAGPSGGSGGFSIAGIRIVTIPHRRRANHQSAEVVDLSYNFFISPFLLCELVAFPSGRAFHLAVFHLHATLARADRFAHGDKWNTVLEF